VRTRDGAVFMMVGDAAGHDPAAAAAMGQIRSASRALAGQVGSPAELVDLVRSSWDMIGIERMATVVYGRLQPSTGRLSLASAGHPPAILARGGSARVVELEPAPPFGAPGGPPPSAIPQSVTEEWSGKLSRGEVLLLYTDGLVERRNRPMQEGITRLRELAATAWNGDPEVLCDVVISQMVADRDRFDDVAVLCVSLQTD